MSHRINKTIVFILAFALIGGVGFTLNAWAQPPGGGGMGMHHMGMGGMHGGKGMHGMGKGGHRFGPHNAAVHFLQMADMLELDDGQVERLKKLRDAWIEQHSADEDRLKAAEADLKRLLFADDIIMGKVEAQFALIGKLEGGLWRAFAGQLAEIKGMLSKKQKAALRAHHQHMGR